MVNPSSFMFVPTASAFEALGSTTGCFHFGRDEFCCYVKQLRKTLLSFPLARSEDHSNLSAFELRRSFDG